jgi:hypothetical protein
LGFRNFLINAYYCSPTSPNFLGANSGVLYYLKRRCSDIYLAVNLVLGFHLSIPYIKSNAIGDAFII